MKTIIETIKGLNPRETLDRKAYKDFYKNLDNLHKELYKVYQARENGTSTDELETQAKTKTTEFLHTLGKCNGKYISVHEPTTTENGQSAILFDILVYHSFKDRIYTKSTTLANLELEKKKATSEKTKAHKALIDGKATAKDYKQAVKKVDDIKAKIELERKKKGAESEQVVRDNKSTFAKFTIARLKAIAQVRFSMTDEQAENLRKARNKDTKARRKANKGNKSSTSTTTSAK
jgi:hypothetical protein